GLGARSSTLTTAYCAKAPVTRATTASPVLNAVTPAPTPSTTPDASKPGIGGSTLPEVSVVVAGMRFQSTGFTPAAYTFISTWFGPGLGVSTLCSCIFSTPGPVCTMAFIFAGAHSAAVEQATNAAATIPVTEMRFWNMSAAPSACDSRAENSRVQGDGGSFAPRTASLPLSVLPTKFILPCASGSNEYVMRGLSSSKKLALPSGVNVPMWMLPRPYAKMRTDFGQACS